MLTSFQKEPKPIDILDVDMVNEQVYLLVEYEDGTKQWVDPGFIRRWYRVLYDSYFNPRRPDFFRYMDEGA